MAKVEFEPTPALGSDTFVDWTVSDANGDHWLEAPVAGSYFVDVTDDHQLLNALDHTIGGQSMSDPSPPITLSAGEVVTDINFGYVQMPNSGDGIVGDLLWADDDDGELDFTIWSLAHASLVNDIVATVAFQIKAADAPGNATIKFSADPAPSFGDIYGHAVANDFSAGVSTIIIATARDEQIFLPIVSAD